MNKLKGWLALVLLLLSWCALYWITGSRTPWNQFHVNNDGSGVSVYLGDIPTQNYDRMGFTKAVVRYAADEEGWIVGTERGELFLFDNEGRQKWKRSLGIGKLEREHIERHQLRGICLGGRNGDLKPRARIQHLVRFTGNR